MFNSHHPQVDKLELLEHIKIYSQYELISYGALGGARTIVLPTVKQFKKIHGVEDLNDLQGVDDSDDENDAFLKAHRAALPANIEVKAPPEYAVAGSAGIGTKQQAVDLWADE